MSNKEWQYFRKWKKIWRHLSILMKFSPKIIFMLKNANLKPKWWYLHGNLLSLDPEGLPTKVKNVLWQKVWFWYQVICQFKEDLETIPNMVSYWKSDESIKSYGQKTDKNWVFFRFSLKTAFRGCPCYFFDISWTEQDFFVKFRWDIHF